MKHTVPTIKSLLPSLVMAFSGGCLALFFQDGTVNDPERYGRLFLVVGFLLAAVAGWCLNRRFGLLERLFLPQNPLAFGLSAAAAALTAYEFDRYCYAYGWTHYTAVLLPFAWLFLFAVFAALLCFALPQLEAFWKEKTKTERVALFVFAGAALLLCALLCSLTRVFIFPTTAEGEYAFDVIYTTDTVNLYDRDAFFNFFNTQNDLRQMWFPLLALPFAIPAKALSLVFAFVPNAYGVFLMWMQILALSASVLIFARIMHLSKGGTWAFLALFFLCFSGMLFSLTLEQYAFPLFWTACFAFSLTEKKGRGSAWLFSFGIGGFLTNAIYFPFLARKKEKGLFWRNVSEALFFGFCLFALTGRLPLFEPQNMQAKIAEIMQYGGEFVPLMTVVCQFTQFVVCQFLAPAPVFSGESHVSLSLPDPSFSAVGVAILLLEGICLFLCRRDAFARLCGFWIAFSFVLLVLLGWGSAENGMILYSSYFCWAYLSLPILALKKLCPHKGYLFGSFAAIALWLLAVNLPVLIEIIGMGIAHYPA